MCCYRAATVACKISTLRFRATRHRRRLVGLVVCFRPFRVGCRMIRALGATSSPSDAAAHNDLLLVGNSENHFLKFHRRNMCYIRNADFRFISTDHRTVIISSAGASFRDMETPPPVGVAEGHLSTATRGKPGTAAGLLPVNEPSAGARHYFCLIRTQNFGKRGQLLFQDRSRRLTVSLIASSISSTFKLSAPSA
jgi:hypothetical protein